MKKEKIAISIDKSLLHRIDSRVDGSVIRSRSQAIELFVSKGIEEQSINTAVIMLSDEHQKVSLKEFKGQSLLKQQLDFFKENEISEVFLLTPHSTIINSLLKELASSKLRAELVETAVKGNARCLKIIKERLPDNFIIVSGDTYNNFKMENMIERHMANSKMVTIGLMSVAKPKAYGVVILDGDDVVAFEEKPKDTISHIVNAGVYLCRKEIFELFDDKTYSIERDLFPKIAKIKQLKGYFTHGEYIHFG